MYNGNHLFCGSCKYKSRQNMIGGKLEYSPCKAIDHKSVKLYTQIYGGYSESIRLCEICGYYEPVTWIKNPCFKNIDEYIEFMDFEWYETSKYYSENGINEIRHCRYVSLIVDDIWLSVPLYDWMNNSWNTENGIKHIRKYNIVRKSNGYIKHLARIDDLKLGEFSYYKI